MTKARPLRVVIAKPGLDGHDRGAQVVARALRDAGMEVIYTGIRQTSEMIVATAIAEDADCIGLSVLSGSHLEHARDVLELLHEQNASDIPVVLGGIVPSDEVPVLKAMGVAAVFKPGSSLRDIVAAVRQVAEANGH